MEMWDRRSELITSHGRRHLRSPHLPTGHLLLHGRVPFLATEASPLQDRARWTYYRL